MRQELGRLNSPNRVFHQLAELPPLLVAYRRAQVLNFDQPLAHEYDLGDFSNAGHPGIANQLGIQRQ